VIGAALVWGLGLCAIPTAVSSRGAANETTSSLSFDLFAFSQDDGGGQSYRAEGFGYGGARLVAVLPRSERATLHARVTLAVIDNESLSTLPATIGNANVTSASPSVLTLDTMLGTELHMPGSAWTLRPSVSYHHQARYLGGGPDLALEGSFFGGDTKVRGAFSARFASNELDHWDGSERGHDSSLSVSTLVGWMQNLSASLAIGASAEVSRQVGFLSDPFHYVTLEDAGGTPILLADEALPRGRSRTQLGVRARVSPSVGASAGLEASTYTDDWNVKLWALEPTLALPIGDARVHLWYRLSQQEAARYFARHLTALPRYRTQDGDLGSFTMHGGGASFEWPPESAPLWGVLSNVSVFGFSRDDGLSGLGTQLGLEVRW
jgi:hypothetical protein